MIWDFLKERLINNSKSIIVDGDIVVTFYDLIYLVESEGSKLSSIDMKGNKCCVFCDKGIHNAIAILTCWHLGIIPIPVSMNYGEKHCKKIIKRTKPDFFITDQDESDFINREMYYNIAKGEWGNKSSSFKDINIQSRRETAIIMCTSGTTGLPKGVMLSEEAIINNIAGIMEYFQIDSNNSILISRPLYHCAVLMGEFLVSLCSGTNIYFINAKFNPIIISTYLDKMKINVICGTPTLIYYIARYYERKRLENKPMKIVMSGECLSNEIAKYIKLVFHDSQIYNVYGLTEAGPRVSHLPVELFEKFPNSVGVPITGVKIRIMDNDMKEVMGVTEGNVMVYTPSIMTGYYEDKKLTEKTIVQGWLKTGDIGYIDKNGLLYISSRADDMIIKNGMNIYPQEIEEQIILLKEVKEVVAYGVQNNEISESIAVQIVLEDKCKGLGKVQMMKLLSNVLSDFQMPEIIIFKKHLDKNASGKLIRPKK